jgi:hypothetical protein
LAASAALSVAPAPILRDEQIFALLHDKIDALVGVRGSWTLVARSADDTDVFFHDLKAREIAAELTEAIATEQAALRGETSGEPTALTWTPTPIATWNDPATSEIAPSVAALAESIDTGDAELAKASAAWVDKASATLASARLVA